MVFLAFSPHSKGADLVRSHLTEPMFRVTQANLTGADAWNVYAKQSWRSDWTSWVQVLCAHGRFATPWGYRDFNGIESTDELAEVGGQCV